MDRQLDLLLNGRTLLWRALAQIGKLTTRKAPYRNEFDLVGRIAFRELDYVGEPDGLPLDPSAAMLQMATRYPARHRISKPNRMTWSPSCRTSGGRRW